MPLNWHHMVSGVNKYTLSTPQLIVCAAMYKLTPQYIVSYDQVDVFGAYAGFCFMNQLRVLLLPPGWDASPSQGYPQQYVAGTHLHTWVERDNLG